jgi:hypothetical protein
VTCPDRKAIIMTAAVRGRCTCGFQPDQTYDLEDHLAEVFTPDDDIGLDGQAHLEQAEALKCSCGFTAALATELDEHFRTVFPPPAGGVGGDGQHHAALP